MSTWTARTVRPLVISKSVNKGQFPDLDSLAGQRVNISGVVQFYRGRAEINLTSARQLTSATGDASSGLTHIGPEFSRGDSSAICG